MPILTTNQIIYLLFQQRDGKYSAPTVSLHVCLGGGEAREHCNEADAPYYCKLYRTALGSTALLESTVNRSSTGVRPRVTPTKIFSKKRKLRGLNKVFIFYLNFDLFIEVFNKQTNCILMITSNSALCGSGRQEQSLLKFMYGQI